MEKQRNKFFSESCRRLLIKGLLIAAFFLIAGSTSIFAQILNPVEGQNFYVNDDIKFEVQVPKVLPAQIDVTLPDEIENTSFKTLRKVESEGGTKIEIWYSFSKPGTYTLPALNVKVRNSRKRYPFGTVAIAYNPKDLDPQCVILTDYGRNASFTVHAGEKIKFKLCLCYAVQLMQFSWDIPKDSLFTQVRTYDFTEIKQRDKVVSDELIPVSDFEWTPLVPGVMTFPSFKIVAVSYSGHKLEVPMPGITVTVLKGRGGASTAADNLFSEAFDAAFLNEQEKEVVVVTEQDAQEIARLRKKEKSSFLFLHKNRKARAEYEKSLSLPYNQKEFALMWIFLAGAFVLALVVLLIIVIIKKNSLGVISVGIILICSLILFIYTFVQGNKNYAVTSGSEVFSIPEPAASAKSELPAGSRVQILSESGDWYFIRFGQTEGWCLKDGIILI